MAKQEAQDTPADIAVHEDTPTRSVWKIMRQAADDSARKDATVAQLRIDAEKMELQMREWQAGAKVAQEVAIARRIETAHEVEIEEFYDTYGSGKVGASNVNGLAVGAEASGRRVRKRIYRFRNGPLDAAEQVADDQP